MSPHSTLCPLGIGQPGSHSNESDHDTLIEAMAASGVAARIESRTTSHMPDEVISLEREIVATSERYAVSGTYRSFLQDQLLLTRARFPRISGTDDGLDYVMRCASDLLGLSAGSLAAGSVVERVIAAMTPFVRAQLILERLHSTKQPAPLPLCFDRIPHALSVLYLLTLCAQGAGMAEVTFQTVSRLHQQDANLIQLLAHLDAVVGMRRDGPIEIPAFSRPKHRRSFLILVKALLRNRSPGGVRLGDLLLEYPRPNPRTRPVPPPDCRECCRQPRVNGGWKRRWPRRPQYRVRCASAVGASQRVWAAARGSVRATARYIEGPCGPFARKLTRPGAECVQRPIVNTQIGSS